MHMGLLQIISDGLCSFDLKLALQQRCPNLLHQTWVGRRLRQSLVLLGPLAASPTPAHHHGYPPPGARPPSAPRASKTAAAHSLGFIRHGWAATPARAWCCWSTLLRHPRRHNSTSAAAHGRLLLLVPMVLLMVVMMVLVVLLLVWTACKMSSRACRTSGLLALPLQRDYVVCPMARNVVASP